jgi:undecaprenyldiphospho-muramoylpentapeptide beta-N-acetylglucosaminyltransferase
MTAFAVITGGGTAGHVLPALAIADALVAAGHSADDIHYVGTIRGVEARMVPSTPYAHTLLDISGLQRSFSGAAIRRNLALPLRLLRSIRAAHRLLDELQPAVVVNVGGYASFPATWAARRSRIPYVVVSYDRRPGLVSRLMARRAAACAVAFPGSALPHAELTGAPVRQELVQLDRASRRASARQQLGLPSDRFVVAVVCGSLGAAAVNRVVVDAVDRLGHRDDLAVFHAVGDRFLAGAAPSRDGSQGILYTVVGFESRMAEVYAAADLMVTRAGAGTIAELATVGVPAIVVPWPGAAENHQLDNGRELAAVGAAVLVEESDFSVDRFVTEVESLKADSERRAAIAAASRAAGEVHRSGRLVRLIERVAR